VPFDITHHHGPLVGYRYTYKQVLLLWPWSPMVTTCKWFR